MKICSSCNKKLVNDQFYKSKATIDNLQYSCKMCAAKYKTWFEEPCMV